MLNRQDVELFREPAPLHNYNRLSIGDVGYIGNGGFVLLFSAAMPLGDRVAGTDVPRGFSPLDPSPVNINRWQPRSPGALRSASIEHKGGGVGGSLDMCVSPSLALIYHNPRAINQLGYSGGHKFTV